MAMAPPRLLWGLIAPLSSADWLPCHHQLLTSAALLHRCWLPSLARLRCSDGFKLLLVFAALAEVTYYMFRKPSVGDIVFFSVPTALQNCGINKDVVFVKRVIATLEISSRSDKASLLLMVLHRMNITPHPMVERTQWKPWSRDTCMPKLRWVITTKTNDYTTTARAKVAWLLRVVDLLSTPIILLR